MHMLLKTLSRQTAQARKQTGPGPHYPKSTTPSVTPIFAPSAAFHTASDPP